MTVFREMSAYRITEDYRVPKVRTSVNNIVEMGVWEYLH